MTDLAAATDRDSLLQELRRDLAEVMGVGVEEVFVDEPLLELGADSIVLVEAMTRLQDTYGIELKVRQFADELATLSLLADHVADVLGFGRAPTAEFAAPDAPPPRAVVAPDDANRRVELLPPEERTFASWRSPDHRADDPAATALNTPAAIDDFAASHAGSKFHADRYRRPHADPRASAGFRPALKEALFPIVSARAEGAHLVDVDGNTYVDLAMGFGTMLLGHGDPAVDAAVHRAIDSGLGVGASSYLAGPLAERICALSGHERATFTCTGTEAVMAGVRMARLVTGKRKIAVFAGAYHGHWEGTLVFGTTEPGQAVAAVGGLPPRIADEVIVLPWDDERATMLVEEHADDLAAVLVEPIQSRRPAVQPTTRLRELREVTQRRGVVLLFDEIVTGFRLGLRGAAGLYGVDPDLVTYGKALANGFPLGVIAGRAELLDAADGGSWSYGDGSGPEAESTFLAGTYARHPASMAAAWAVTERIEADGDELYARLEASAARLQTEANHVLAEHLPHASLDRCGSMMRFQSTKNLDLFYRGLVANGVYVWEGRTCYVSAAHTDDDIDRVVEAVERTAREIAGKTASKADSHPDRPAPYEPTPSRGVAVPLTRGQQDVWLAYELSPELTGAFHNLVHLSIEAAVDVDVLEAALQVVIGRHEGFRLTFDPDGTVQYVHDTVDLHLDVRDVGETEAREIVRRELDHRFDPVTGPLWHFLVLREPGRTHLVVSCSDLVADGLSITIAFRELGAVYDAMVNGRPWTLKEPLQLSEYVDRLRSAEVSAARDAALGHWTTELSGVDRRLALPCIRPRAMQVSFQVDRTSLTLPGATVDALRTMAKSQGATLFTALLTSFAVLLHKLTGQDQVVIGAPTFGRVGRDVDTLVASCANPVPIVVATGPDQVVADILRSVRDRVLSAFDHSNVSASDIARAVRGDGPPEPLFRALMNLDPRVDDPRLADHPATVHDVPRSFGAMDLAAQMVELRSGLLVNFDFNTALFDRSAVATWLDYFVQIVHAVSHGTATTVAEISLAPAWKQPTP